MKPDLMERVRRLDPVPDPAVHAPDTLLERIVALPRESGPRHGGRRGRLAAIAAIPAAVALAIMVVVGVRTTQTPEDPLASLPAARVDWGMDVRMTLHPDPDISLDDMRMRVKTAIAQRAEQLDAAGISVHDVDGDTMTVRLPGTQSASEATSFLTFTRMRVLDEKRSVLGQASTLEGLRPYVAAAGSAPPNRTVVYVQPEGRLSQPLSAPMPFSTAAAPGMIESLRRSEPSRKIFTLEVPVGTYVVGDSRTRPTEFFLVRPVYLVPPSSVEITVPGPIGQSPARSRRLVVSVSPSTALPTTSAPVLVMLIGNGDGPDDETQILGRGGIGADQRSLVVAGDQTSPSSVQRFGHSDIGGTLTLDEPAHWGTPPALTGSPVATPRWAADSPFIKPGATWLSVVRVPRRNGAQPVGLLIGVHDSRIVAVGESLPGGHGSAVSSSSDRGICEDGIGAPRVLLCDAGAESLMRVDSRLVRIDTAYGRVRPGVARVAVRAQNGTLVDATIQNGWFMASADTIGPRPKGASANLFRRPVEVLAWDGSGDPVPVVEPFYG